jgi:hypothetical protein
VDGQRNHEQNELDENRGEIDALQAESAYHTLRLASLAQGKCPPGYSAGRS